MTKNIYSMTKNRFLGYFRFIVIGKMVNFIYCHREIQGENGSKSVIFGRFYLTIVNEVSSLKIIIVIGKIGFWVIFGHF